MTFANPAVLEFYRELPFNYGGTVADHVAAIRSQNQVLHYSVLPPLLGKGVRLLDVGCGAGWFSSSAALYYGSSVCGIDFNPVAIERAKDIAKALRLPIDFQVADLFGFEPEQRADVVVSLGVLHHTDNCRGAVARICTDFVKPGGHAFIGLYHAYGRKPFLDHFRRMREAGATEERLLREYGALDRRFSDETKLRSWFRDQVLYPHETQHTLKEMVEVVRACGMELVATSIIRFQPFSKVAELFELEAGFEALSAERLARSEYFPGFFLFLARKPGLR